MPFYTRKGDQGTTGLLGGSRVPKNDVVMEVLGTLDEFDAALGVARSQCMRPLCKEILYKTQKDMWLLMADVAGIDMDNNRRNAYITDEHLQWVEKSIEQLSETYDPPRQFIVPGDTYVAGLLDVARTIVRRAERRFTDLLAVRSFHNPHVQPYLNRLSSLCYALELSELALSKVNP